MAIARTAREEKRLNDLLRRDHTLNGGILLGLEGFIIEIQARAVEVMRGPESTRYATGITGMARQR